MLETGSTQLIRNTAAQQLADVQKNHPDELFNLLTRVVPYLRSPSWDTRTAAAKAIGGIAEHAEKFDPNATLDVVKPVTNGDDHDSVIKNENGSLPISIPDQLQLATLDVESILTYGKELLGSAGKQYDFKLAGLNPTERLNHQKKTLTARLGLGGEYIEEDLVSEKDIAIRSGSFPAPSLPKLDTEMSQMTSPGDEAVMRSPESMAPPTPAEGEMSKRQLNMLKRRRKEELKRDNKKFKYDFAARRGSTSVAQTPVAPDVKQEIKQEPDASGNSDYFTLDRKGGDDESKVVSEFKGLPAQEKSSLLTEA